MGLRHAVGYLLEVMGYPGDGGEAVPEGRESERQRRLVPICREGFRNIGTSSGRWIEVPEGRGESREASECDGM